MIVQNPLIGRARKSAGGMTATTILGKNVLKATPISVANPKTDAQLAQRARQTMALGIYQSLANVIKTSFKEAAVGMYPVNKFVSINQSNGAVIAAGTGATFVPANLEVSKGSIGSTPIDGVTATSSQPDVVISFDNTTIPSNGALTDKVVAVAYNETKNEYAVGDFSTSRGAGSKTISFASNIGASDAIYVYLGFVSADSKKASNSVGEAV